jgi:hypothetical protein
MENNKLKVIEGKRPTEAEVNSFNLKMKEFKRSIPDSVKSKEDKVDKQLLIEINDRLLGPNGVSYEEALIELNNKKDESGNLLYPKIESKYGHDIWKPE